MKNYLVLHIDTDFLVGTVCADENNLSYPIKNGNEEFLWLYFYNDPYSNTISFGKENQKHCSERRINYYGNFTELIENKNNTFSIGEYEYPIIDLLRHSKIIDKLKNEFSTKTLESQENIPTLITFSLSISELSKQKLVDYLKKQGFSIDSYTIPLAELACKYALINRKINYANGNIVTFLEATNVNLHLLKLIFTTDYFLLDGNPEMKQGLGIDPRKRALLKFVVNKIGTMGILTEQEKETEYKIMEPKTDQWLNRLDLQTNNAPVDINESLSRMPNAKRRILIYKDRIAEFTNSDIKLILDTYNDYVNRNISQDISAIVLLGNLFQNDIIKSKFKNLINEYRLFIYANKDIQNILSVYPKIDFQRYASEEKRIKAKAAADEQKKAEQRAIDATKEAEAKAEQKRLEAEKKAEENRRKAKTLYEQAVGLDKGGELQGALAQIENAIDLDVDNMEYKGFADVLKKKIEELNEKTEKYKSWLKDAEFYEVAGDLNHALNAFKYAQEIFDSAELRKKIVEIEHKIKQQEKEAKIDSFINIAITLADKGRFEEAISNINKALDIDPANKTAKETLKNIYALQHNQETEKKYKEIAGKADMFFKEQNFDKAVELYNEALLLKTGDKYCTEQIAKIKELILQKQNQEKADKIVAEADKLFENELWEGAKAKYEESLKLCLNDKTIQSKINDCKAKLKAIEDTFNDLLFEATVAERRRRLKEALSFLEQALKIKPKDITLRERIKRIQNLMKFDDFDTTSKTDGDDFLGLGKAGKQTPETKKSNEGDFLGVPKKEHKSNNGTKKNIDF